MVEGILYHRLFGTSLAAKSALQGQIRAQAGVDLDQAMCASQDGDEGVVEFVERRILHTLLSNLDSVADGTKQIDLAQMQAQSGQAGGGRKVPSDLRAAKLSW